MKIIFISIFILLSSSLLLQIEAQNLTAQQKESIKSEVDGIFEEMLVFAENLDYDKLSSGVDDTHMAGFITNGKYYSQYSFLIEDFKLGAQAVEKQDISIKEKKTTVLSDKIVLMTVSGGSKVHLTDGREIPIKFHWSFVFEKIDDHWKVIHSHQSRAN